MNGPDEPRSDVGSRSFGEWRSPLSAEVAAAAAARFGAVLLADDEVVWTESMPDDGGRMAIWKRHLDPEGVPVDEPREFRPEQVISARSRINEYGGGAMWMSTSGQLFWVDAETQRVHTTGATGPATHLTPPPPRVRAFRYAAGSMAQVVGGPTAAGEDPGVDDEVGCWMFAEREVHVGPGGAALSEPVNDIVAMRTDTVRVVPVVGPDTPGGGDFVAAPRLSPDGSTLAWLRWDHPDMPWDAAELWAAMVTMTGRGPQVSNARRVAGGLSDARAADLGRAVSVCLPEWSPDGRLWWCDDADDWWHLRSVADPGLPAEGEGDSAPLLIDDAREEVGEPRWVSGGRRFGFTDSGRIVFVASSGGLDGLWVVDPRDGSRSRCPGPEFTYVESIVVAGNRVAAIAGTPLEPTSVWLIDLDSGTAVDVRDGVAVLDPRWVSTPQSMSFDNGNGATCHALVYCPAGAVEDRPEDELPPLLVRIHGGPTAAARSEFSTSVHFWTTRGFAVADVNYRGSTGFGRRYRDSLRGQWGVKDVQDCLAVARHLSRSGVVDPGRCVIRGGSSGGFTALAAVCFQDEWGFADTISAACSLYGVTDLAALARDTHKFESRYLEGLVGAYPEQANLYEERSPLHNAEKLTKPVLMLQGADDRIVPRSQAEALVEVMERNGIPHSYVLFQGEGHGFVNPGTVVEALELELAFYGAVLGFTPAGDLPEIDLD